MRKRPPADESTVPIAVLKFGSSVLRGADDLDRAVLEIYGHAAAGFRVVVVVSAYAGATDALLARARKLGPARASAAGALLVATGEHQVVAELALALEQYGVPAQAFDAARLGLACAGPRDDAMPTGCNLRGLASALQRGDVAVVPGYVGCAEDGSYALLGRGGSDLTALFLAAHLGAARCRLLKDVDGLYERDPRGTGTSPRRYATLPFAGPLALDECIVQRKAAQFAADERIAYEVGAPLAARCTRVGPGRRVLAPPPTSLPRHRVALLGCGAVGSRVLRLLRVLGDRFELIAAYAGEGERPDESALAPGLVRAGLPARADGDCDVLIDTGSGGAALAAAARALRPRAAIASANAAALWECGGREPRPAASGAPVPCASAAVGGSAPILRAVARLRRRAPLQLVEAILDGSLNSVLHEVDGIGAGSAHALAILARAAFGQEIGIGAVECDVLSGSECDREQAVRGALARGRRLRRVCGLCAGERGLIARIADVELDARHPLAGLRDEETGALIAFGTGAVELVRGRGAGPAPLALALVADVLAAVAEPSPGDAAESPRAEAGP